MNARHFENIVSHSSGYEMRVELPNEAPKVKSSSRLSFSSPFVD